MSKPSYNTTIGGGDGNFPETAWTQLLDPAQKKAVLDELCAKYWKPLYCYLRRMGFDNERAKDLVQGFLTEKVIDQELIRQVDRTKGKLRTFLLTAIRNYTINIVKKDRHSMELDGIAEYSEKSTDPEVIFDRVWADELLKNVLEEVIAECDKRGKSVHWLLFRQWFLESSNDQQKNQMKDLCSKYNIENAAQAYHMIENIKRRFRSILREHLRSLVDSEEEVETEIRSFIRIFQ